MKQNIIRSAVAAMLAAIMVLGLCSCGKAEVEETTTQPTTVATTKKEVLTDYNRLTGIDDLSDAAKGKRPVAIMINNIKASLPQYGISKADLMFEVLVEGGITRMMAVYGDYTKVPNVCSVRSCRYYFPIFAHGLDAVYFCYGSNPTLATPTLKRIGIDYFNASENNESLIFGRDSNRLGKYSKEHTAFVKGQNMPQLLDKYKIRTDYKEGKDNYIFNFRKEGDLKAPSKSSCETVRLNFSNSYYSTFTYDSGKKVYLKQHSGKAHMDSVSGEQLAYTNVFVLETDVSLYQGGPLVQVDWKGGTGYYISCGAVKKIKWSKKNEEAGIKITDTEGKSIKVNAGKSYIGVINYDSTKITESTK
ncbi:MAG: DUF3048 domain-containing protein [Faecalibacterium sp.]|nr:DUF3048 domain-containing protein [Ruminococcus sp.]MCM1391444.1 DUF3048 domain-containing protein [Ruminococcus sp.]MCM1485241.1 DUF3048 domain-containing protein [Faecalibacterium sp.]